MKKNTIVGVILLILIISCACYFIVSVGEQQRQRNIAIKREKDRKDSLEIRLLELEIIQLLRQKDSLNRN